jgi:hypothetical protein
VADDSNRLRFPDNDQPPSLDLDQAFPPARSPLTVLREGWAAAWTDGGVLFQRWEDLRTAADKGWHGMAHWIKAVIVIVVLAAGVLLVDAAGTTALHDLRQILAATPRLQVGTDTGSGIWAVIDNPVKVFIATRTNSLPISGSTVYTLWALTGAAALVLGFVTRGNGWRMTWVLWGAASIGMVWSSSPADGRTIATGLAVLAWSMASAFALRGINLRPRVFADIHNAAPQITITNPPSETPDNVTPLPKD